MPSATKDVPKISAICSKACMVFNLSPCWLIFLVKYLSIFTTSGFNCDHRRRLDRPSPKSSSANDTPALRTCATTSASESMSSTRSCSVISRTNMRDKIPRSPMSFNNASAPWDVINCFKTAALILTNNRPGTSICPQFRNVATKQAYSNSKPRVSCAAARNKASGVCRALPLGPRINASWAWIVASPRFTMGW